MNGCCGVVYYFLLLFAVTAKAVLLALADALEWMCRDDEKRLEMGRAGQQRAEHYFRQESMMKKYREMYDEVNEKWQESVSN